MQAAPTIPEIPVFAGVLDNDRRLLDGGIDGEISIFNTKAKARGTIAGSFQTRFRGCQSW